MSDVCSYNKPIIETFVSKIHTENAKHDYLTSKYKLKFS